MEFDRKLTELVLSIQERAKAQFEYNLETNIKAAILKIEECADQAIECGIVSAVSKMNDFGIEPSLKIAHHILEDVNAHTEANELVQFIPEYQGEYWKKKESEKKQDQLKEIINLIYLMPSDDNYMFNKEGVLKELKKRFAKSVEKV